MVLNVLFFQGICTNILKIKINGENIQMLNFKLREVAQLFSKFPVIYLGPDHLVTSLHTGTFDSNFSHTSKSYSKFRLAYKDGSMAVMGVKC